jgi:hypothetical protein
MQRDSTALPVNVSCWSFEDREDEKVSGQASKDVTAV